MRLAVSALLLFPALVFGANYYVDCSATRNGNGSQSSPWNALSSPTAKTFSPGDQLLLRRGTTCSGVLYPKGSGTAAAPIKIDAYDTGALPVIDGGSNDAVLTLFNQQYWEIANLEITRGVHYGVWISGNRPSSTLNHIYLRNLDVHSATFQAQTRGDSALVIVASYGRKQTLVDVLVDGVVAHDSTVSEGIVVSGGGLYTGNNGASQTIGDNLRIVNSTVHDVGGDGILLMESSNGLLEGNVVYNAGECTTCTGSTPAGLWEWYCKTCTVQNNESYAIHSWGGDGGAFDIDYYNENNVVQYNYGHDADGYCVSFFGAERTASVKNIFRYNVCANNGRNPNQAYQGDVWLYTWGGGSLDGVQIYNNTFYWNPAAAYPLLNTSGATFSGSNARMFRNNIVYSTVPSIIETGSAMTLDYNVYYFTGGLGTFKYGGTAYSGLSAYAAATGQDGHSVAADPQLIDVGYHSAGRPVTSYKLMSTSPARFAAPTVCTGIAGCTMGTRDFFGNTLPTGSTGFSIGADQAP